MSYLSLKFKRKKNEAMKPLIPLCLLFVLVCSSCDRVKSKTKETINKGGETVGKTATEFFDGVSEGIDQTLKCELSISQELKDQGLNHGAFSIKNDDEGGLNNVLSIYLIFNKDFKSSISIKAFNTKKLEIGRSKLLVEGKEDEAQYFDFIFDPKTSIESRSTLHIE